MLSIKLSNEFDPDLVFAFLQQEGFDVLYSSESPEGDAEIYLESDAVDQLKKYPFVVSISEKKREIDWESQWRLHGKNYKDGFVHVPTTPPLRLIPGPGFGDLSHPTTELVLSLMPSIVENQQVLDIGSGSGVLSLAASRMGAKEVWGIDIDPEAIIHAEENAIINNLEQVRFTLAGNPIEISPTVCLMNMIFSEQKIAFIKLDSLKTLITSGIRVEEEEEYINWIASLGFRLAKKEELQGWLGFVFTR